MLSESPDELDAQGGAPGQPIFLFDVNGIDLWVTMLAYIENLVKLQNVDLERARLTQAGRALPLEITQAEAALAAAQRQVVTASDALSREESLRSKLDREVADY